MGRRPVGTPQMAADYASGMTVPQIAEKHGCTPPPVYRYLRSIGITAFNRRGIGGGRRPMYGPPAPPRRRGRRAGCSPLDQHAGAMHAAREYRVPLAEIGDAYGISREAVRLVLIRNGYATQKPPPAPKATPGRNGPPCALCGAPTYRGWADARVNLCTDHQVLRQGVLRLIDPDYHERHTALVRRTLGLSGRRTYEGNWKNRQRRWMNRGSNLHRALLGAYEKRLPIIGLLPPDILDQIAQDYPGRRPDVQGAPCG